MKRLLVMTVGKTHSGKTTFAKALEKELAGSVVIDQDQQAEFLHTYYQALVPAHGPNKIKYALTRTLVDYAADETGCHIILCNANRNRKNRLELLGQFHDKGFTSILVHFDIPEDVLQERVSKSERGTTILRTATSFEEVLAQQQAESRQDHAIGPLVGEADHLFIIKNGEEVAPVLQRIAAISK